MVWTHTWVKRWRIPCYVTVSLLHVLLCFVCFLSSSFLVFFGILQQSLKLHLQLHPASSSTVSHTQLDPLPSFLDPADTPSKALHTFHPLRRGASTPSGPPSGTRLEVYLKRRKLLHRTWRRLRPSSTCIRTFTILLPEESIGLRQRNITTKILEKISLQCCGSFISIRLL